MINRESYIEQITPFTDKGPNVGIYIAMHPVDWRERASRIDYGEPVTIGDYCWIGGSDVICPGVTIGNRCIIAAGAKVVKDVPDDSMVGGLSSLCTLFL